jgi:diguanylate cyclase (GGDEF)-like protein/PAS domain S-box-containing protein
VCDDGLKETLLSSLLSGMDQARIAVLVAGGGGGIEYVNGAFERMTGLARAELVGQPAGMLGSGHEGEDLSEELMKALASGSPHRGILCLRRSDGGLLYLQALLVPLRNGAGDVERAVILGLRVGSVPEEEPGGFQDAFHDPLTGLPNRTLFLDRLGHAIARVKRNPDRQFAVFFLDLDRFKVVNDGLGHETGDRLLAAVGERLRGCLRESDSIGRLGGDEFGILLEEVKGLQDVTGFAGRLLGEIKTPFHLDGREVYTTASIGIASSALVYEDAQDVLRDADIAMYRAKSMGGFQYAVFDRAMHEEARDVLELETDLRRAVERREFRVHFQPIVSLVSGRVAGFEALLRWTHVKRGRVPPSRFIPLAEETGLINPLGLWTIQESIQRLQGWHTRFPQTPPLFMSVNLSGLQLLHPELIMNLDLMLREHGIDGRNLKVEITESVIMEHAQYALDMLQLMKQQNIRICIDDFGTGYSSMSYLKRYPIDTIKVDQSFVSKMTEDDGSLEIVRSIVTMAHNLKMEVVAEGIETHLQLARLRALRCEYGQGFFFAKALEPDAVDDLLSSRWYW